MLEASLAIHRELDDAGEHRRNAVDSCRRRGCESGDAAGARADELEALCIFGNWGSG